jgi:hypothetical protein
MSSDSRDITSTARAMLQSPSFDEAAQAPDNILQRLYERYYNGEKE